MSSFRYLIQVFSNSSTACSLALLNSLALIKSSDVSNVWCILSLSLGDMPANLIKLLLIELKKESKVYKCCN